MIEIDGEFFIDDVKELIEDRQKEKVCKIVAIHADVVQTLIRNQNLYGVLAASMLISEAYQIGWSPILPERDEKRHYKTAGHR